MVFSIFLTQTCTTYKHANVCTQPCSFFNYLIILRCTEIKIIYLTSQGALSDSFGVQSYHLRCLFFFRFLGKSLPVPAGSSLLSQSGFFSDSLVEFMILYKNPTGLGLCSFGGGWEPGGVAMCSLCLGRLFYLLSPGEHSLLPVLLKPWLCPLRWSNSLLPLAFF